MSKTPAISHPVSPPRGPPTKSPPMQLELVGMEQYGTSQQKVQKKSSHLTSFVRWLQLKKYQYEVTFSLYMLTSTEKFIFNMIIFILVSMLLTAAFLYLPNHVSLISNRVWYYVMGEFSNISVTASNTVAGLASAAKDTRAAVVTQNIGTVVRHANEL